MQTFIDVVILLCIILTNYSIWRIGKILRVIIETRVEQDVINEASTKMFCILMEELREHQSLKKPLTKTKNAEQRSVL